MRRLRGFAFVAVATMCGTILASPVPAAADVPPYSDSIAEQDPHASPTGGAGATSSADESSGQISVTASASESILPAGVFVDGVRVGVGASRAESSARMLHEIIVNAGGTNVVTVHLSGIQVSATATAGGPLSLVAAAVNAQVVAFFFPCPTPNTCSGTPTTSASSGLVPVAHTAIPFPQGPPTSLTLTTVISASGPGFVRIDTGFYARTDASGVGSAAAQGSATVQSITLAAEPPPTTTLYEEDATLRVQAGGPTANSQAAASADKANGALNVSTAAYETVLPSGFIVENTGTAVGMARAHAIARVIDKVNVGAGPHPVTVQINGISASGTRKLSHALSRADSAVTTKALVDFVPCPDGPPCSTVPSVVNPPLVKAIFHTAAEGVPTSVTLSGSITAPVAGIVRVDVGFYARSDAVGQSITGTQAAGTVSNVTVS